QLPVVPLRSRVRAHPRHHDLTHWGVQLRGTVKNHGVLLLSHLQNATNTKPLGQPHKSVRVAFTLLPHARLPGTAYAPKRRYSASREARQTAPYATCRPAYRPPRPRPAPYAPPAFSTPLFSLYL